MAGLLAAAGLVAIAAITPGPNNLIVMRTGARAGLRGAAPAIGGVVLGGVTLLALVVLGGDALFRSLPGARTAVAGAGGLYLAYSGASLVVSSFRRGGATLARPDAAPPLRAPALFAFQLLNPKGWAMVLAATSAVDADGPAVTLARLVPLFVVVPAGALTAWASFGAALGDALRRPSVRSWSDRVMGALLLAAALLLHLET